MSDTSYNNNCLPLQREALEELRHRIANKNYLDKERLENNNFLLRYLKFHQLDVSKAEKSLRNYWKYCNTKKMETLTIELPLKFKTLVHIYAGARDYQNRPVIQILNMKDWQRNMSKGIDKNDEFYILTLIKKLHWHMENELLASDAEYAVVVVDLLDVPYTFSLVKRIFNICTEHVKELIPVSPDLVGRNIILNAPKIVRVLAGALQTVLRLTKEQRNQCIMFSPGDADLKEHILKFIPEDQIRPEFGGTFTGYQILL